MGYGFGDEGFCEPRTQAALCFGQGDNRGPSSGVRLVSNILLGCRIATFQKPAAAAAAAAAAPAACDC